MSTHNGADDEPREGVILPSGGGEPWSRGPGAPGQPGAPASPSAGSPWGRPWGPEGAAPGLPPAGAHGPSQGQPPVPPGPPGQPPAAPPAPGPRPPAELPRVATPARPTVPPDSADAAPTQMIPPIRDEAEAERTTQLRAVSPHGPRPGEQPPGDEGATQMLPPVRDDAQPTQAIPPVRDDDAATTVMPPVAAGDPATTQLRAVRPGDGAPGDPYGGRGAAPWSARPAGPGPAPGGGDFDGLFRSAAGAGPGGPHRPYDDRYDDDPGDGRSRKAVLAIVAIVVLAGIGLGAGALLGGGDDSGGPEAGASSEVTADASADGEGDDAGADDATGAPDEGTDDDASDGAEDAARAQATALSDLLEQSNDSRDAVVRSVGNIRGCRELDAAVTDLRAARDQRNNLVGQLQGLDLSALDGSADLVQALTEAWQASAEADEHYAAWAEEAKNNPDVCRGGSAQHTDRANQGDAASGRATEAKQRAADLWNPLATAHGLPEREPGAL
ncbi:hypothetical protein [Streptomyces sp. RFCAC02]|uniref:hypothetical protein n=1 Tax=Streptomyces sp. RFCAC02 TaxID=2499143 RepID=UPI0010211EB3|nr:hypothetical protein [Streptomyces sp. RFCAC02]